MTGVYCTWVKLWELPNLKTNQTVKQTQPLHFKNASSDKTTLNREHNLLTARSHLFPLCKTCRRQIQLLNKLPLVKNHGRKEMFRLLLQKQTSDSGRWWNRADPKSFLHSTEPAKPGGPWNSCPSPSPWEKDSKDQRRRLKIDVRLFIM